MKRSQRSTAREVQQLDGEVDLLIQDIQGSLSELSRLLKKEK